MSAGRAARPGSARSGRSRRSPSTSTRSRRAARRSTWRRSSATRPVRLYVMGEEATERAGHRRRDRARCGRSCAEAIDAGAIGFATSKSADPRRLRGQAGAEPGRRVRRDRGHRRRARRRRTRRHPGHDRPRPRSSRSSRASPRPPAGRSRGPRCSPAAGGPGVAPRCCSSESTRAARRRACRSYPQVSCRPLNFEFTMAEPFPFESMTVFEPISARRRRQQGRGSTATPSSGARSGRSFDRPDGRACSPGELGRGPSISWYPARPVARGAHAWPSVAAERGVDPTDLVLDLALEPNLDARFRMAVLQLRRGRGRRAAHRARHDARPLRRGRPREPALRRVLLDLPAVPLGAREAGASRSRRRCAC